MNAIAPLVFLLAAFVLVSFTIRCVAWLVGRRRDRAVRRPHWTSVLASVLAAAVLAVQLAAVHVERARYRAAEDAVASSATRSDIETRLGLPRELAGEQVFLDGPVLSTNLVLKDEWRYNFDSPLSPFAFSHDLVIGFRPDDTIDYAYWARFGLPPSAIPFAQSPDTPSSAEEKHAERAENAEPEPRAESAERAKSTNEVFDEVVGCVLAAVEKGREPNLRLPPADEWGNPFSVTNEAGFVSVRSFGADGKKSEDDFLLTIHWGEGFANVDRVYFDEELQCQIEEGDNFDW